MKIGIDISQLAYPNTGVSNYLGNLVNELIKNDKENEYVLFFSSLRGKIQNSAVKSQNAKVEIKKFKIPPLILNLIWNKLHILPIEWFVGDVDVFITSDWTEPPARTAKKATILYDLLIYKYPDEMHNKTEFKARGLNFSSNIVSIQKQKLKWVKKESKIIFCISKSTAQDAEELLGIEKSRVKVLYPGL